MQQLHNKYKRLRINRELEKIEKELGDFDDTVNSVEDNLGKMDEEELQKILQSDIITYKEIEKILNME